MAVEISEINNSVVTTGGGGGTTSKSILEVQPDKNRVIIEKKDIYSFMDINSDNYESTGIRVKIERQNYLPISCL
jgi:hypothetical protein